MKKLNEQSYGDRQNILILSVYKIGSTIRLPTIRNGAPYHESTFKTDESWKSERVRSAPIKCWKFAQKREDNETGIESAKSNGILPPSIYRQREYIIYKFEEGNGIETRDTHFFRFVLFVLLDFFLINFVNMLKNN